LKFVSELLFPDDEELRKMDVDASKMDEEWATRPEVVLEYCARDSTLPLQILRKIQATRRKEAIAAVAKVPFETAANGTTSQLLDSLVIRLAEARDVAVPMTGSAAKKEGQITGGYVHDVEAGMHPWIAVLDFKSMYPSIMIGNNVCHTTRIDPSHPIQPAEGELVHISPTGAQFRNKEEREGLVPFLLQDLMSQRDLHKTAMKQADADGDASGLAFHDQMQYAVKIMMNSFYGVFASGFYRFTHRDLGSSITAWARRNIKGIIQRLEEEGHHVVYSDTDSIFVRVPVASDSPTAPPEKGSEGEEKWLAAMEEMLRFGQETAERFSEESAVLEFETGLSAFFSHGAKKRYVGRVVWPNDDLMIKGYETQRTDSFEVLTKGMQRMFELVLDGDEKAAIKLAREQIEKVKKAEVAAEELVISKLCKGEFGKDGKIDFSKHYANPKGQAQVQAARKRIERNLPFTPGMKIGFVVTNARNRPMEVEPWNEAEENGGIEKYDAIFYAERLATAFGRVCEAFGWSADELLKGNRQSSLFSF
jgi:DNA polymerase I